MRDNNVGKSVLDLLWEKLDRAVDKLERREGRPSSSTRSYALGIAECIAILLSPHAPDIDAVRAEAMARLEDRQELNQEK